MRYRAKKDFVLNNPEGNKTFIAQGDKVFIQQYSTGMWEVYGFYSRNLIAVINEDSLQSLFGSEEEFKKPPRDNRFKGRKFGGRTMIFLMLLPFMSMGQVNPVVWDWKAVRVDATHFEFQIRALIARGWWIYAPNRQDECPYSPIVTFERSLAMKPVERIVVLEYLSYANNEGTIGVQPPFCPIPQYRSNVIFMQLFKMPIDSSGVVKGQITFQAMSRYFASPPTTVDFELHIGAERDPYVVREYGRGRICTTYPKGFFRKAWHRIKHPLGHPWIKKEFLP
jgi:hypothetical protein